jgi:hypothetical protein
MQLHNRRALALIVTALIPIIGASLAGVAAARKPSNLQATSTPIMISLPTNTPLPGSPTPSPTRTPTEMSSTVFVEAITEANVRTDPEIPTDTTANITGKIQAGTRYPVLGVYYEWYEIEYPTGPGGVAWVHNTVVNLVEGDLINVPNYSETGLPPTSDPGIVSMEQTALAITQTPGIMATLTELALITPTGIFTGDPNAGLNANGVMPTFTYPVMTGTPVMIREVATPQTEESGGLPPLLPIVALGALGLLGFLISLLRRL